MINDKLSQLFVVFSFLVTSHLAYGSNAGVLPVAREHDQIWVMVGLEKRKTSMCWVDYGGKINPGETPKAAAIRELKEETAGHVVLTEKDLSDQLYLRLQGYHAYFVDIGGKKNTWDIKKSRTSPLNGVNEKEVEKNDWLWIKVDDFFDMLHNNKKIEKTDGHYTLYGFSSTQGFPLYQQYRQQLLHNEKALKSIFQKLGYTPSHGALSPQSNVWGEDEWVESYEIHKENESDAGWVSTTPPQMNSDDEDEDDREIESSRTYYVPASEQPMLQAYYPPIPISVPGIYPPYSWYPYGYSYYPYGYATPSQHQGVGSGAMVPAKPTYGPYGTYQG